MVDSREIELWYDEHKAIYKNFANKISELLATLIVEEKIPYHSITYRLKTKESYIDKCKRKDYTNPTEGVMDMAGIRVITYTTSDVDRICDLITNEFVIDEANSGNKAKLLESDKVGYLSVHYIAKMADERTSLREYSRYKNLVCEIQVRTLLQHAWAEIEHDRSYKFSGVLPENIRRRFHLVAGVLEMMDSEFQRLSDDIDFHVKQVREEAAHGNLDMPLDTAALIEIISAKIKNTRIKKNFNGHDSEIIEELHKFGVETIGQVCTLFTPEFMAAVDVLEEDGNYLGLLRDAMICFDTHRYFEIAWDGRWMVYSEETYNLWVRGGADTQIIRKYIFAEEDV